MQEYDRRDEWLSRAQEDAPEARAAALVTLAEMQMRRGQDEAALQTLDRRLDEALAGLHAWMRTLVAEAQARLAADPSRAQSPANFLEAMVAARDEEGRPFAEDLILGNLLTMLVAGEDTTAYDGDETSTAGSWEAGVDDAQPGIQMLGDPIVGARYRQE